MSHFQVTDSFLFFQGTSSQTLREETANVKAFRNWLQVESLVANRTFIYIKLSCSITFNVLKFCLPSSSSSAAHMGIVSNPTDVL